MENFLSSKPAEFYLRKNNKLPAKWQKVIQNNGEYTFNWNWLIVELFMNKLQFTKRENFYDLN